MPELNVWYSEGIGKIRAASTPGGESLTVDEAEAFRSKIDEAIAEAQGDDID